MKRLLVDKAVDMSEDGGWNANKLIVRYFANWGRNLKFILDFYGKYPQNLYDKLVSGEDQKPEGYQEEVRWEFQVLSKITPISLAKNRIDIDFYDFSDRDKFEEERIGWSEEPKYSWPAFWLEQIRPDPLFWSVLRTVNKKFFDNIFGGQ
jgi:hypothetical protein